MDVRALLPSWELHLRAERKADSTVTSYLRGVRDLLRWCDDSGNPAVLDRRTVNAWIAHMLERGAEGSTARARQLAVRRFSAWAFDEGEQASDPLLGMKAPKIDVKVVEPLTDDQLKAMLRACSGTDLRDRRDAALIRLMTETGMRAGEVVSLRTQDIDLNQGVAIVRRGKGGKGRTVPFGSQTAQAIDRYRRVRQSHRLATSESFWLGDRGKTFSYDALHKALGARATAAGVSGFHPHRLRHTAAHRWLAAGGSEGGLMAVAGWTRPDMLLRYTTAQAESRAAAEARNLNLGDL